jgi:hypothetical protein
MGFHEMRAILGEFDVNSTINLDAISENTFRILLGCPIRIGCNPGEDDTYDFKDYDQKENENLIGKILENTKKLFCFLRLKIDI